MRKIRRQIGMVFQQFNLVKRSSVLTNVLSGRLGYVNPTKACSTTFRRPIISARWTNLEQLGLATRRTCAPIRSPADSSSAWALRAR